MCLTRLIGFDFYNFCIIHINDKSYRKCIICSAANKKTATSTATAIIVIILCETILFICSNNIIRLFYLHSVLCLYTQHNK